MSSTYLYVYVKSSDSNKHELLGNFFKEISGKGRPEILSDLLSQINPKTGNKLWEELKTQCSEEFDEDIFQNFVTESDSYAGYWKFEMYPPSHATIETGTALVAFFGSLDKTIDSKGHDVYSGDPGETFYLYSKGKVIVEEYVPRESLKEDDRALKTGVYAKWHKGVPELRVGLLEVDLNDINVVITGKPIGETIRILDSATIQDMNVQKNIDDETDLLVICEGYKKADIDIADDLGITTCSEFNLIWSYPDGASSENSQGIINSWKATDDKNWHEDDYAESDDELELIEDLIPKNREITVKAERSSITESSLYFHTYWGGEIILDDMSQVRHGDFVKMKVESIQVKPLQFSCTFIERNQIPMCPYCSKPLRTVYAKQCPHCFKNWRGSE